MKKLSVSVLTILVFLPILSTPFVQLPKVNAQNTSPSEINVNEACAMQKGKGAESLTTNKQNPYSWICRLGGKHVGKPDLNAYCVAKHGANSQAVLLKLHAHFWRCASDLQEISVDEACAMQKGKGAKSLTTNKQNPYSWTCRLGGKDAGKPDLDKYCVAKHGAKSQAVLLRPDAYSWRCTK